MTISLLYILLIKFMIIIVFNNTVDIDNEILLCYITVTINEFLLKCF